MTQQYSLDNSLKSFLLDCKARNLTNKSIKFYTEQLNWFFNWFSVNTPVAEPHFINSITANDIRGYYVYLQNKGVSSSTVHAAKRSLSAFLNYCVKEELLAVSPLKKVKSPKVEEKLMPAYTVEDISSLLANCDNTRDRTIVLFLLDSLCRAEEMLQLNVEDINLDTGVVILRKTKNRKPRIVYIGFNTRKELIKLFSSQSVEPTEPVFRTLDDGKRLGYEGLSLMLRRLGMRASVKPCNAHRFRRTGALNMLRNGVSIAHLKTLMGHSNLTVLMKYLAVLESDLQDVHQQFGAVDNLLKGKKDNGRKTAT